MLSTRRLLRDANQPFIAGFFEIAILNGRSHRERSFREQDQHSGEGPEAASAIHLR